MFAQLEKARVYRFYNLSIEEGIFFHFFLFLHNNNNNSYFKIKSLDLKDLKNQIYLKYSD